MAEQSPHVAHIRNVSDTALWVAIYRAMESERPDALFDAPFARRMAGERGEEIVATMPMGATMAWSIIVRTVVIDEVILRCIENGAKVVLNLGAGLDTRAFRLRLPRALRWIDVDLPAMTVHRQTFLDSKLAHCKHAHVAADFERSSGALPCVQKGQTGERPHVGRHRRAVGLSRPRGSRSLAQQLRAEKRATWWIADLITPILRQTVGMLWHSPLGDANAPFKVAPPDSKQFFRAAGWHETEIHSTWSESIRRHRPAPQGLVWDRPWKWASPAAQEALKRMSGVALLNQAPTA